MYHKSLGSDKFRRQKNIKKCEKINLTAKREIWLRLIIYNRLQNIFLTSKNLYLTSKRK